jgi:putative transposase
MRYIEMNPVRTGMVSQPEDYPWSSYRANAQGETADWLTPHRLYRRLGKTATERLAAYRQLFQSTLSEADLESIREATNKAWVLGNDRFRVKIEMLSGRRATRCSRVGPVHKMPSEPEIYRV